ncbi:MAG: Ig-like domain-containing protein [Bacteroidales bacterium]|nr:Ig-like domain-containing protein [Bacteroidales bacterium]
MKKFTLLLISVFFGLTVFAQKATTLLSEDFSSGIATDGWTIDDMASQWSSSSSSKAGGTAPEAKLTYVSGTHTSHLISPSVDLTGYSTVIFSFKHYLSNYSNGYTIGVATRSGGGNWNTVWSQNPSSDIGPTTKEIVISNSDVGASNFQIALFLNGNWYNFNYWYIDDIKLYAPDNDDISLSSINTNRYIGQGNTNISCTIKNSGLTNLTSADINYQIDNGSIITEILTGLNLSTTQTLEHTFTTPWDASPGNYNLKVWLSNMNGGSDDNPNNDTLSLTMHVATQSVARTPLYEEFTSSTCSPCATFNSQYFNSSFLNNNAGNYSLIKYQMSWPSPGDPYYTAEGGVRRGYYGVSGVPTLFLDAHKGTFDNTAQLQTALDNANNIPAYFTLNATHQITGDTISIQADILPYINAKDFTVQTAVVEKTTTGNIGNNGETEFHYVMMKMLPDAAGTKTSFSSGIHSYFSQTYDLSGTHVEDMNDLAVIVFIQNDKTKEIFQSGFSAENTLPAPQVSFSPANGSTNIDNETDIKISFNQYMRFIDNSEITSDNISAFITVTDPSNNPISYTAVINDSKSIITITPDTYLPESSLITVTVNDAQIEGINNIALSGKTSSFTTGLYPDANAVFSPSDGADNIDYDTNITITFDDPMKKTDDSEITNADISSFVTLTDQTKGDITFTGTINYNKTKITIDPDEALPGHTEITATITGNEIKNIYNKFLDAISATFTVGSGLGINDISEFVAINPNPVNNFITVSGINNGQITITDISGKQVLSQNILSDKEKINIQNLPSGIYIIKIISDRQIATQKIIKK